MVRVSATAFMVCMFAIHILSGCTWRSWAGDFAIESKKFSPPRFEKIALGNSKADVAAALGEPDARPSASKDVGGRLVEVWEYWEYEPLPGPDRLKQKYHVVFGNEQVEKWGTGADFTQEIRMR